MEEMTMCCPVRNFPQGYGNEMAEDVERAIAWVIQNIELYGGDPENVTVAGQSAGAHLSSFVLVRKATEELEAKLRGESEAQRRKSEAESQGDDVKPMRERREVNTEEIENGTGKAKWSTKQIKKYIGVSGPYDLAGYVGYLHSRGLPNYMLYSIFQGELSRYSPTRIVQDLCKKYKLVDASGSIVLPFPPTVLVHGTSDVTMPSKASEEFGKALEELGVKVDVKLHLGKTHTDCIMEDIFLGENVMLTDIVKAITDVGVAELVKGEDQEQDSASDEEQETTAKVVATAEEQLRRAERKWRRLAPAYYPGFLVRTAQKVNPF